VNGQNRESYGHIIRTLSIAIVTGISAALVVYLFNFCLERLLAFVESLEPRIYMVLPLVTALVVGLLIMRKNPSAGGEGVQFYITAVNIRDGRLSTLETVLRFPATLLTLSMFGAGGTVGPLARMGAGIGSILVTGTVSHSPFGRDDDRSVGAICGVSGAISAIFHSPLAAGLYATEVLRRESIRYTDLIVALLSAVVSFITSSIILGEDPFFVIDAPDLVLSAVQTTWLPVTAFLGGLIGVMFIFTFRQSTFLFRKIPGRQPVQILAAAVLLSTAVYAGLGGIMKTAPALYTGLATGDIYNIKSLPLFDLHLALPFVGIILAIVLLSSITIGCGMSAGFTGPLVTMGMTLGALVSLAAGTEPASAAYYAYMACGMSALLSTTLNIPLAAIALTMTVFGTSYILPAVTGSSIAFILFKGNTVYQYFGAAAAHGSKGNNG
jgi:CIC family chloride channel protein